METEELIDRLLRLADEEEMAGRLSTCLLLDKAISRLNELHAARQWRPIEEAEKGSPVASQPNSEAYEVAYKTGRDSVLKYVRDTIAPHIQPDKINPSIDLVFAEVRRLSHAQQWRLIETAPKDGTKVIGHYKNERGKSQKIMMRWLKPEDFDDYFGDIPEEARWYEDSETHCEELLPVEHPPTHFMPLPPAPQGGEG